MRELITSIKSGVRLIYETPSHIRVEDRLGATIKLAKTREYKETLKKVGKKALNSAAIIDTRDVERYSKDHFSFLANEGKSKVLAVQTK